VAALMDQYQAQTSAYYKSLQILGLDRSNWRPQQLSSKDFVEKYLRIAATNVPSNNFKASEENAKAMAVAAEMEKARFLPKLGVFAESQAFSGDRDMANSYTAGLYLQWSLFDPADYGKHSEALLKANASSKQLQALRQQEEQQLAVSLESEASL